MMAKGEVFKMSDIARIVAKLDSTRLDRPTVAIPAQRKRNGGEPAPRPRNEIIDALKLTCNMPEKLTRAMGKRLGTVAAQLKEVDPNVTGEEVQRRGAIILSKYGEKAGVFCIAMHWHETGPGPRTPMAKRSIYVEPDNWRDVLRRIGKGWDQDMLNEMLTAEWLNISSTVRLDILKAISSQ